MLVVSMIGVGIAWASILSMPYAILSGALPAARMGVYMGVFNFFIVIPEITQALTFGWIIRHVFGENNPKTPLYMVTLGGIFILIAAALVTIVRDVAGRHVPEGDVIRGDESEPVLVQESVQPVPSTGSIDKD
jgi:maltose/moltooligosaccharide transporter